MQRTKRMIQTKQNIQELWNNNKGEEREKGGGEMLSPLKQNPVLLISRPVFQRINLQNIQAAHAVQYQKNKTQSKSGKIPKQTFLQRLEDG